MDRYLDSPRTAPLFVRQEAIARLLVESSRYSRFGRPNRTTLGARPPGGPANQGLHREQPREGRLGGARAGVPVVERQSAVESRDDSRLSKPGGLRHARGRGLG